MVALQIILLAALVGAAGPTPPSDLAPPAGYYATVDESSPADLRVTLHEIIDDHTRYPYRADPATDTWDILNLADEDPNNSSNILDVYKNASYTKIAGGVGVYNREHTWPKSYGFPDDLVSNYPYTDCHHLFASDASYNSSRGSTLYRTCPACTEKPTEVNNGQGGGMGVYPGNSNWRTGTGSSGTWETWIGRRGDVARALLYLDVRYEGGTHGVTGHAEPDLILTDNEVLVAASNTGDNESVAYMGMLNVLLDWHDQDPPDDVERERHEIVYVFQGNRNPFIDNPEWVACVFLDACTADSTPPAAPTGLVASARNGGADLTWLANPESDLAGYNVYRSTTTGGPFAMVNGTTVSSNAFNDTGLVNGTTYYYVVTAVDTLSNESSDSAEASVTPMAAAGGGVLLSEVLYDVSGGDSGWEWVELYNSGDSAVDLSGWSLGNGGADYTYSKVQLSGIIPPGGTFVVGGPSTGPMNASPELDQVVDFDPDFQNSGGAGDGVGLFDVLAASVNASTVPVDAVVYGPNNNNGLIDETGFANAAEVNDAVAGSSIERTDLAGAWSTQGSPTPNVTTLGSGPAVPEAPGNLTATAVSETEVNIFWEDNSDNEDDFEVAGRGQGGSFVSLRTLPADSTGASISGLEPGTSYGFRVRARNSVGNSPWSNIASAATHPGSSDCTTDTELCLGNDRFTAEVDWRDFQGNTGSGQVVESSSDDSGLFWFFNSNNWEMMVKVLDGCNLTNHFWVFAAATTNVEYTLTVTDTVTGAFKEYFNPLGNSSAAITDTEALATCGATATTVPGKTVDRLVTAGLARADIARLMASDLLASLVGLPILPRTETLENRESAAETNSLFLEASKRASRVSSANGESAETAGLLAECTPSESGMCLNNDRFKVEVLWEDFKGTTGAGQVVDFGTPDSGLFWFFNSNNWEMMVKVLNGCNLTDHFWVFAAATTNVEYTLRVTDTATGAVKVYFNPLGNSAAAITDTGAFATCD